MANLAEDDNFVLIPKEDKYILDRGYLGSTRLLALHYLWQKQLGYILHPSITLKPAARVADIACGTCAWALDCTERYPDIHITALDISLQQCPSQRYLPSNLTLKQWDFFTEPPANLIDKFDIINISNVLLSIPEDPLPVIHNLSTLLAPGGYLQWSEPDITNSTVSSGQGASIKALRSIKDSVTQQGAHRWITSLQDILNQNGFEDARVYTPQLDMRYAKLWTEQHMLGVWEAAMRSDAAKKMVDELLPAAQREVDEGGVFVYAPRVVVARKKGGENKMNDDIRFH